MHYIHTSYIRTSVYLVTPLRLGYVAVSLGCAVALVLLYCCSAIDSLDSKQQTVRRINFPNFRRYVQMWRGMYNSQDCSPCCPVVVGPTFAGIPSHSANGEEPGAVRGLDKEPDAEPGVFWRSRGHLLQVSQQPYSSLYIATLQRPVLHSSRPSSYVRTA